MTFHLSCPEVDALCVRAGRGVGMTWGMAEECGKAAAWLARHGFDWATLILACLEDDNATRIGPAVGQWHTTGPVCGLRAGVTFADFALLPEGPLDGPVTLRNVVRPATMLSGLRTAAAFAGRGLSIQCDDVVWAHVTRDTLYVAAAIPPVGDHTVSLSDTVDQECYLRPARDVATAITSAQKARLDALALQMTVPTSAQSQAGAGAQGPESD